ncbi:MAG: hypothetical protein U5L11_14590 [Arhodomonas sp.]|nr:hypothetical protein [Arhodomonas sp.]
MNRAAALEAAGGDAALAERLLVIGGVDPASGRAAGGSLLAAGHTGEIAEAWAAAVWGSTTGVERRWSSAWMPCSSGTARDMRCP